MNVTISRLATIWGTLRFSRLVVSRETTDDNIAEFVRNLNMSIPITEYEIGASDLVRYLYRTDRGAFFRYIKALSLPHMVLLTNGNIIATELGIANIVSIRWDNVKREFTVIAAALSVASATIPTTRIAVALNTVTNPDGARVDRTSRARTDRVPRSNVRGGDRPARTRNATRPTRSIPPLSSEQCATMISGAQRDNQELIYGAVTIVTSPLAAQLVTSPLAAQFAADTTVELADTLPTDTRPITCWADER